MNENNKSRFELIPELNNFMEICKNRAKEDNKKWPSAYYPSAEICSKPKYCLIALEPGKSSSPIKDYAEDVKNGRRIFFPAIITYCAWRYLCDESYDFQITDLVKSTKGCELTKKEIKEQRKTWLPFLKKELELLGNPTTIFISKELYNWLSKKGLGKHYVYHYSGAANGYISDEYEYIKKSNKIDEIPVINEIKKFVKKYMKKFGDPRFYTDDKIDCIIEKDETLAADNKNKLILSNMNKKLFAIYRHKFTCIRKGVKY